MCTRSGLFHEIHLSLRVIIDNIWSINMGKNQSKVFTMLFIVLMFNSILYYNLEIHWEDNPIEESFKEINDLSDIIDEIDDIDDEISDKIRKTTFVGDYKTKAFFSFDNSGFIFILFFMVNNLGSCRVSACYPCCDFPNRPFSGFSEIKTKRSYHHNNYE